MEMKSGINKKLHTLDSKEKVSQFCHSVHWMQKW